MNRTDTPAPIRAVIFDCDGTLVDSEGVASDVLHELACAEGLALSRAQTEVLARGVRMAEVVRAIAAQLPHAGSDFAADFTRRVRAATDARFRQGMAPMPGAAALLQTLALPCCVATNGPREKVELTLTLTGLRHFFAERVFCAYEVGSFKPDPGLFLHAAHALGQPAAQCAVVEDSVTGVQAGLAAGMQVFSLLPRADLPPPLAHRVCCIDGLAALKPLLSRHAGA